MGNAMPCLVDQGTKALPPAVEPKRRMYSLKLLTKALRRMKKTPCSDRAVPTPKAAGKSQREAEVGDELRVAVAAPRRVKSVKASYTKAASPRRAAAAARRGGGHGKGVVRVKVLLSKEEAARLLSLTVGGQTTAAQIVAEIRKMEALRAAAAAGWRPALASIPEESS